MPSHLTRCLAAGAALAAALLLPSSADAGPEPLRVVLDQSTVPLRLQAPATAGLVVHVIEPRVLEGGAARPLRLPVAWKAQGGTTQGPASVTIDEAVSAALRTACTGLDLAFVLTDQLRRRTVPIGVELVLLTEEQQAAVLVHETRPTDVTTGGAAAWLRVVTRGDARDRWYLAGTAPPRRGSSDEPVQPAAAVDTAAVAGLPEHLLQVDLIGLGLHEAGSTYALPAPFLHATLRFRAWSITSSVREWDRMLMVGTPVASADAVRGEDVKLLLQRAVDQAAAALWPAAVPEEAQQLVPVERGEAPAAAESAAPGTEAPAVGTDSEPARRVEVARPVGPDQVAALLQQLAASRLKGAPTGDPWSSLARAVEPELPEGMALALRCAEDPLGAAVDLGAERLGLSVAEAYGRVESTPALKRSLGTELVRRMTALAAGDKALEGAAPLLVTSLTETAASPEDRRIAAAPLLERAREDGARSPGGIAALLLACRLSPERAAEVLRGLLASRT